MPVVPSLRRPGSLLLELSHFLVSRPMASCTPRAVRVLSVWKHSWHPYGGVLVSIRVHLPAFQRSLPAHGVFRRRSLSLWAAPMPRVLDRPDHWPTPRVQRMIFPGWGLWVRRSSRAVLVRRLGILQPPAPFSMPVRAASSLRIMPTSFGMIRVIGWVSALPVLGPLSMSMDRSGFPP